jgi:hypothetical protein
MSRCVVIHTTGSIEVQDFHPLLHQRLRGLGYRRFVIQFVQRADQRVLSAPVYARLTPSAWHVSEAGRKLWGPRAGATSIVDEHGETVAHQADQSSATDAEPAAFTSASDALAERTREDAIASARARMRMMDANAMEHRLRSLAHRWLYLVDRNDGNVASFDELFAAEFELAWTSDGIRTRDELFAWYRGVSDRVLKSSHTIADFTCTEQGSGRYGLRLDLQWYGFTREQPEQEIEAKTRHEWTVADDPSDRFARIEKAKLEVLVPAQPRR